LQRTYSGKAFMNISHFQYNLIVFHQCFTPYNFSSKNKRGTSVHIIYAAPRLF